MTRSKRNPVTMEQHLESGPRMQKNTGREPLIAELQEALASEKAARVTAEKANKLKDQFLAAMSHDVRTPLNVIIGWAKILSHGNITGPIQQRAIETIENNARLQNRLMDDMLDMSRSLTGRLRLNFSRVDLVEAVRDAIEAIGFISDSKKIEIVFMSDETPVLLNGDGNRLQQVFWNILSSSVKFTNQGGRINISLDSTDETATVMINDSGPGIDAELLPHMFESFDEADGSGIRANAGTGFALSLVRRVVELHGGTVRAERAGDAQGTVFTVILPLTR